MVTNWSDLTYGERLAVAYRRGVEEESWQSIIKSLDIDNEVSFRRRVQEFIAGLKGEGKWPPAPCPAISGSRKPKKLDSVHWTGDALVLPDPHVPYHDGRFISRCVSLARAWGIQQCVIDGDLFDFAALSKWKANETEMLEVELEAGERFIDGLADSFQKILVLMGNHDERLRRVLDKRLTAERLMRLFTTKANVSMSGYHYMTLTSGGQEWRITHPRNSSVIPVGVARRLADKHQQNIVAGHGHLWGQATSTSGRWIAIDSGMCGDPERIGYNMEEDNVRPAMVQGAVIVRDSHGWLLHPRYTDWNRLMNLAG